MAIIYLLRDSASLGINTMSVEPQVTGLNPTSVGAGSFAEGNNLKSGLLCLPWRQWMFWHSPYLYRTACHAFPLRAACVSTLASSRMESTCSESTVGQPNDCSSYPHLSLFLLETCLHGTHNPCVGIWIGRRARFHSLCNDDIGGRVLRTHIRPSRNE